MQARDLREDLTGYSDDELSLRVFNDEGLYRERHKYGFTDWLSDMFKYTSVQFTVLEQDLAEDE